MENRREYETFNRNEAERENEQRLRSGRRKKMVEEKKDEYENRQVLGGLEYDAASKVRSGENRIASEPKISVIDKEDDPKLFRQSMDMLRLKQ